VSTQYDLGTASGRIVIDASSLDVAKAKAAGLSSSMASSLKTVGSSLISTGKTMTTGFTLPVVAGLAFAVKAFNDAAAANAQTAARIKSTGGAANVTMGQVQGLADQVRNYSGIEDEAVQEGQNMLLTFTKIRNEAGAGNDIFTQSTKILADLSVAFGQDMPQAAIKLGKALNDPIKGLTALSKVGVAFTQQQKDQIITMMENNDVMGAQKIILHELTTEFGGSAKAQGKTPWGKTKIALSQLGDQFERLGGLVAPVLASIASGLKSFVDWITRLPGPVKTALAVFVGLMAVMGPLLIIFGQITKVIGFFLVAQAAIRVAAMGATGALVVEGTALNSLSKAQSSAALSFGKMIGQLVGSLGPIGAVAVAVGVGLVAAWQAEERASAAAREMARSWGRALVSAARYGTRAMETIDVSVIKALASIGRGIETLELFKTSNQGLASAFRTGGIDAKFAAGQFQTLIEKAQAGTGFYKLWADVQTDGATASEFARQRVAGLSEEMFKAGTITKEQLVQNLVLLGSTMGEARVIADGVARSIGEVGRQTDITGRKINSFAGLTVAAFETWREEVVTNLKNATPALEALAAKAKITSTQVVQAFRRQQHQFESYGRSLGDFAKLDIPDDLKKQVIDMGIEGGATMEAFNKLTDRELKQVSQSFRAGQRAIKGTDGPLQSLTGQLGHSENAVKDLDAALAAIKLRFSNLDLNVTTHFNTEGTPPPGFPNRALGGTEREGRYTVVGERGPELMFVPKGASIMESSKTLNLLRQMADSPRGPAPFTGSGEMVVMFELDGEAIHKVVKLRERETRIRLGSRA